MWKPALAASLLLVACSRNGCGSSPGPAATSSATPPPSAAAPSSAPRPSASVATVAVPTASGPPREVVTGDGITLTETADGRVILRTTDLWDSAVDVTYSDCDYYRGAVPVLERTLTPERAKLLGRVCKAKKR